MDVEEKDNSGRYNKSRNKDAIEKLKRQYKKKRRKIIMEYIINLETEKQ